jgi:hypothetical protein
MMYKLALSLGRHYSLYSAPDVNRNHLTRGLVDETEIAFRKNVMRYTIQTVLDHTHPYKVIRLEVGGALPPIPCALIA